MNIFKVLASRKKFPEDMTSVLLGWLMYPDAEHGLKRMFLERFINSVTTKDNDIIHQLESTPDEDIRCSLEENVSTAFIDVVYFFGDYAFAIENKIYDGSVEEKQLQREYTGLRKKYPDTKIFIVFLVPDINPGVDFEYNNLKNIVETPHECSLVTWSDTICNIIDDILNDATISIVEQTRFILESLRVFIDDGFYGYDFADRGSSNGTRSNYPRSTFAELKKKTQGFVGVALGSAGLLKMSKEEILNKGFQYDNSYECSRQYWLPLHEFLQLVEQRINGTGLPIGFKQRMDSTSIYNITCLPENHNIYIGIKGGERGLYDMTQQKIDSMSWQLTKGEQPNSQWISGSRYKHIYEEKFPERVV